MDLFLSSSLPRSSSKDKTTLRTVRRPLAALKAVIASHFASLTLRAKYPNQPSPLKETHKSMKKLRPPKLIGHFSKSKLL